jgi:sugar/nucleoside kinase (ribokinase family)
MGIEILCIGITSYDIFFPMDGFPEENRKYKSDIFQEAGGGPAATAAYLLGSWGAATGFAGSIGGDGYGEKLTRDFDEAGVDYTLAEVRENYHTPLSWIINNRRNGSRTILNRRDENDRMDPDLFRLRVEEKNAASGTGHTAGSGGRIEPRFILFDSHELDISLTALELFPDAVTVIDAGSRREGSERLAPRVNHIICSESFAQGMAGLERIESDDEMCACVRKLREINPRPGAVTLGGRGALMWDEEGSTYALGAYEVEAVDTTGAGDIFHGAFVYAMYRGDGFRDAMVFASAAAALSAEKPGGRESIPMRGTVDKLVKKKSPPLRMLN